MLDFCHPVFAFMKCFWRDFQILILNSVSRCSFKIQQNNFKAMSPSSSSAYTMIRSAWSSNKHSNVPCHLPWKLSQRCRPPASATARWSIGPQRLHLCTATLTLKSSRPQCSEWWFCGENTIKEGITFPRQFSSKSALFLKRNTYLTSTLIMFSPFGCWTM